MNNEARLLKNHDAIITTTKNRFYSNVKLPNENGCMEWIGGLKPNGYGVFSAIKYASPRKYIYKTAHRYSYYLHYGNYNKRLSVLHKCDNPKCVAPDHLYLGTQEENMHDMKRKKRASNGGYTGEKASRAKLSEKEVKVIKARLSNGDTQASIAREYNLHKSTIRSIYIKKNWKNVQ